MIGWLNLIAFALSVAAVAVSLASAIATRREIARRATHDAAITKRYGEACALIALIAKSNPPIASPGVVALCEVYLAVHGVEVTRCDPTPPTGRSIH